MGGLLPPPGGYVFTWVCMCICVCLRVFVCIFVCQQDNLAERTAGVPGQID